MRWGKSDKKLPPQTITVFQMLPRHKKQSFMGSGKIGKTGCYFLNLEGQTSLKTTMYVRTFSAKEILSSQCSGC
jgi:hypothetical protein